MPLPIVHNPDHLAPLPPGHRFPMAKFGRVYDLLIQDGIATIDQFHWAAQAAVETLALVHDRAYVQSYLDGTIQAKAMRRIGFPWSEALVNRTRTAVASTVLAAQLALEHGLACSTAGGTHHAYADFGSGFCIFNDLAVAARTIANPITAQRALIVDLDVHQGDGTAKIFQDDDHVFTLSMHCRENFPFRKQRSDLDVELPAGTGDDAYLAALQSVLPDLLETWKPDLVLYDAGVDVHKDDQLGKLALGDMGIARRDRFVLESCLRRGIPIATVIGGGYSADIDALSRRHCSVFHAATELWQTHRL